MSCFLSAQIFRSHVLIVHWLPARWAPAPGFLGFVYLARFVDHARGAERKNVSSPVLQIRTPREVSASEPPRQEPFPLLSSGFRSFFFSAALAALVTVPIWLYVLQTGVAVPYWSATRFHAHEMIFGYTGAVIAGFLLTAGSHWTEIQVATGGRLLALNLLWLAGRVLPFVGAAPPWLVAVTDLAFFPALGLVLGLAMWRSKNRRNYFFVLLLALLSFANLLYHAEQWGESVPTGLGRGLGLFVVSFMILVMGGRVIPMFTRNATSNPKARNLPWLDRFSVGSFVLASLASLVPTPEVLLAMVWVLTGALNLARMVTWGTRRASAPLLWILHAGYASMGVSFVLYGLSAVQVIAQDAALHCLTFGGIGLLTLGMMARVSLGHSGRMLVAPGQVTLAFVLLSLGVVLRVSAPLLSPSLLSPLWMASGGMWTLAFLLLTVFGVPIWFRPRVD